jgi:hypothetical protein
LSAFFRFPAGFGSSSDLFSPSVCSLRPEALISRQLTGLLSGINLFSFAVFLFDFPDFACLTQVPGFSFHFLSLSLPFEEPSCCI